MLVDDSALFSLVGCGSECTCLAMESAHDLRLIPQAFCPKSARLRHLSRGDHVTVTGAGGEFRSTVVTRPTVILGGTPPAGLVGNQGREKS
eukprot:3011077-Rhodomonas_salina.2